MEWPAAIWTPSPSAPGCLEDAAYLPGCSPAFWQERPGHPLRGPQPLPPRTGDKSGLVSPLGSQPSQLFPAAPPCASAQPVSHRTSPLLPDCVAPGFCLWLVRGQDLLLPSISLRADVPVARPSLPDTLFVILRADSLCLQTGSGTGKPAEETVSCTPDASEQTNVGTFTWTTEVCLPASRTLPRPREGDELAEVVRGS